MRIIVTERIADEGVNYLRECGFEVDTKYGISHAELLGIIENYDAIIVRSVTKVNKELIEKGVNLKVAGRAGNGIDNIDVPVLYPKRHHCGQHSRKQHHGGRGTSNRACLLHFQKHSSVALGGEKS